MCLSASWLRACPRAGNGFPRNIGLAAWQDSVGQQVGAARCISSGVRTTTRPLGPRLLVTIPSRRPICRPGPLREVLGCGYTPEQQENPPESGIVVVSGEHTGGEYEHRPHDT